jgi:hypothetical protein
MMMISHKGIQQRNAWDFEELVVQSVSNCDKIEEFAIYKLLP